MNKVCGWFIVFMMFLTAACSTSMPETKIYTLHLASGPERGGGRVLLVIHMDAERYLKQPYIAYRSSVYRLDISKYSKWESSPYRLVGKELESALASAGLFRDVKLSRISPEGYYRLEVDLKKFERTHEHGEMFGELAFDVSLFSPDGKSLYRAAVSKKEKLNGKSFSELARGLSRALAGGIEEVSAEIVKAVDQQIIN